MTERSHGDFHYRVAAVGRSGRERVHDYASDDPLSPGGIVRLEGRYWLIASIEPGSDGPSLARAEPARYRLRLRHPDGREELGAVRRFRPGAPRLGHVFTTFDKGQAVGWEVVDEQLARDDEGDPYLDLIAERNYEVVEQVPDHELEHTLVFQDDEELPAGATATIARAQQAGLALELVALEPGEEPDWEAAQSFVDSLVIEEVDDDLVELCGVDPDGDPRETWLGIVKERLSADLERFQADIEGDHDEIEEWRFRDGRIFASVGSPEDEADPGKGHGWMCRLADAEALGAAGFARIRKAELHV